MKAAMKASVEQDKNARDAVLATGYATLTHKKGGEWAEAMPRLLMEVRDELRKQQSGQTSDASTIKPNKNSKKNRLASAITNDILLESSEKSSIDHENC